MTVRWFPWLLGLVPAASLLAQCDPAWVAAGGSIGAEDRIRAMTLWDPDGAGPQPERLVVAGDFAYIGDDNVSLIAMLDPVTGHWQQLGAGIQGYAMWNLAVLTTGELVVSGSFQVNGAATARIASFDGVNWSWLSTSFLAAAMIPQPNGELVVATNSSVNPPTGTIRRWDGSAWTQIAPEVSGRIATLVQMPNGDFIAGGQIWDVGGQALPNIVRWDGATWTPLGSGVNSAVNALTLLPNGDLVAGGYFTGAGGQPAERIARWDGNAWHAFGSGLYAVQWPAVWSLSTLANGDLIVGGYFNSIDGVPATCIARWSNGVWSDVGVGVDSQPEAILEMPNGDLMFGGTFRNTAAGPAYYLARWNGAAWSTYGSDFPCNGQVFASTVTPDGDLVIAGAFSEVGGVPANQVARRTSSGWQALGTGVEGTVRAVVALPDGDVVVGGYLSSAGGVPVAGLARWDGSQWSPIPGLSASGNPGVQCMQVMSDGALLVGGTFQVVGGGQFLGRWDGTSWSTFGSGPSFTVTALAERANGDIVVAVAGSSYFTGVERWDGSTWSSITGSNPTQVRALLPLPNGDVLIAGFLPVLSQWDGAAMTPLPLEFGSWVSVLARQPNGDVLAAGRLVIGGVDHRLARWDGTAWTGLETGIPGSINTLSVMPDGEIVVAGSFSTIGGLVSPNLASLVPTCPATAVEFGAGCVGSNGLEHLAATALPWVGGTFRARATGMPDLSFVATITGFTQLAVPLTLLFPQAGAGCIGHCSGDAIEVAFPVGGEVTSQVAVPSNPSLVGVTFEQYALAFEFDLLGSLVEVTSTNGLSMTIGTF